MMSGDELTAAPAGTQALMQWANDASMETIPVLDAHNFEDWGSFEVDFATPSITHIGPDMRILSIDDNIDDPTLFWNTP